MYRCIYAMLLTLMLLVAAGCVEPSQDVPQPAAEQINQPPPAGLEANPARPQPARPGS